MKFRSTKVKKISDTPLAVVGRDGEVCMFVRIDKKTTSSLGLLYSDDGVDFINDPKKISIKKTIQKQIKIIYFNN